MSEVGLKKLRKRLCGRLEGDFPLVSFIIFNLTSSLVSSVSDIQPELYWNIRKTWLPGRIEYCRYSNFRKNDFQIHNIQMLAFHPILFESYLFHSGGDVGIYLCKIFYWQALASSSYIWSRVVLAFALHIHHQNIYEMSDFLWHPPLIIWRPEKHLFCYS